MSAQQIERPRQRFFQRRFAFVRKSLAQFIHAVVLGCGGERHARVVTEIGKIWVDDPAFAIETAEATGVPDTM